MRKIGAHISISGGLIKAEGKLRAMGGNCLQIFSSSPKSWEEPQLSGRVAKDICPVFIHAKYLINLGSPNPELVEKSVKSLQQDLQAAELIGAQGVIVHLGSDLGKGFSLIREQLIRLIKAVLRASPKGVELIIENSAGQKGKICSQLSEIGLLLQFVNDKRFKWCLDTCHAYGAGISFGKGLENTLHEFDLVNRLVCLHVNDSKGKLGGGLDRHENIGEGNMGLKELAKYINYPAFKNIPLVTEAPGFDGNGPDRKNLEILRQLSNS